MGAAWSLVLASEIPEDIGKVVLFYGVGEGDFAKIKAEILGHFSDTDEWEPLDGIRAMEEDMRTAGLELPFTFTRRWPTGSSKRIDLNSTRKPPKWHGSAHWNSCVGDLENRQSWMLTFKEKSRTRPASQNHGRSHR